MMVVITIEIGKTLTDTRVEDLGIPLKSEEDLKKFLERAFAAQVESLLRGWYDPSLYGDAGNG